MQRLSFLRILQALLIVGTIGVLGFGNIPSFQAQGPTFQAEINKSFTPLNIPPGGISRLRVSIYNTNTFPVANAAWLDNLAGVQPGIYISNPANMTNTCGGVVVATPLSTTLSLSGGTIPAQVGVTPGSCYVEIDVTSVTPGNLVNTIPIGGLTGTGGGGTISNTTPASATLRVSTITAPTVSKAFTPNTVFAGETSQLAITVRNTDLNITLTQASITDNLPANVTIASLPANSLTNCGASATLTAVNGTGTITLNNASIAPATNCVIRVNVVSNVAGTYTNTIPASAVTTQQGVTNAAPASANLNVQVVNISKAFNPASFQAGGTSTLTITLQNPTGTPYTNVTLADTLPAAPNANLTVVAGSATTTCGAGVVTTTLPRTVTLTGGTIPAGSVAAPGTCTITVQVTAPAGAAAASYNNTIPAGAMTTAQGVTNALPANATVSVYASGTGVTATKSFNPATINAGQNSRLRLRFTAPADTGLTNFAVTDNLPAGVTISNSTAPAVSGCGAGAVLTAVTGTAVISLTNGTIPAGTRCQIDVYVTSATGGVYVNSIPPGNITNTENRRPPGDTNATLTVLSASDLSMSKAFFPPEVAPNGLSTLTITLQNTNSSPLINVSLTDPLPIASATNGVFVAPVPNISTTCGGTVTITTAGAQQNVVLTGGTIPAQVGGVPGICTITLDVQGRGVNAVRTNTIPITNVSGTIQSSGVTIQPAAPATADLRITNLAIGVIKGFNPLTVFGGSVSTMSIQLINPNNYLLTGIQFTDSMPAGMILADPTNFDTGLCGGTITGTAGTSTFTFSGGSLAANTSCFITASVTMTVNANLTNSIPAGSVTTFNGAANPQLAEATLTNLPGASISKVFVGNPINAGGIEYSMLVITIRNTGNTPITGMGLIDNLPGTLPSGLVIAGSPAPAADNTCNGTLTAVPGTQLIQLTSGSMAGNAACALSVPVSGQVPGTYTNNIPVGTLTNDQNTTNSSSATDTLTLNAAPALSVAKNLTSAVPAAAGGTLTYDIIVTNTGTTNLTGVVVTDPGVGVVLGTCTPVQPAALAPGASMTCPASHVVTQADIDAGLYSNTAIGDSDQTDTTTDTRIVNFTLAPAISLVKTGAQNLDIVPPNGVANPGDRIAYTFAVTNTGSVTLTNVTLADTVGGVTISGGPIASLNPGVTDSTTFSGLYILTQADINKGSFTNTATTTGTTSTGTQVTDSDDDTQVLLRNIDPPFGQKLVDADHLPRLRWTVIWINDKNTSAINASSSDGIPVGTTFFDNGVPSGHPLPAGTLPAGSVATGVVCEDTSTITTTSACYYEGPTTAYPRGRIVWSGLLGPDFGVTDPAGALNEIRISFNVRVDEGTGSVTNTATIDVDLNGDGDVGDPGEVNVASAAAGWSQPSQPESDLPSALPATGFAPGRVTGLPVQPKDMAYSESNDMTLEIPAIGVNAVVAGVPMTDAGWQLAWLGRQVGYLEGTAFPTWNGNSVLTAHVYDADGKPGPFVDLRKMGWGQRIIIHAWGQKYTYEVRSVRTRVSPTDASVLKHENRPWLTLITCQGYDEKNDTYRWRVVVKAVLVSIE